jgi:anti-sigma factor RsiW
MASVLGPSCDRTRALLSRRLDTKLSELERRAVAVHTDRCAACRAFARDSRWITTELRAAPLEPLPRPVTVTVPRRPFPIRVVANVASAAALLIVAVGGVTLASQPPGDGPAQQTLPRSSALDSRFGDPDLREIRREALLSGELRVLPADTSTGIKPALSPTDA